jgi:hypothetical protein
MIDRRWLSYPILCRPGSNRLDLLIHEFRTKPQFFAVLLDPHTEPVKPRPDEVWTGQPASRLRVQEDLWGTGRASPGLEALPCVFATIAGSTSPMMSDEAVPRPIRRGLSSLGAPSDPAVLSGWRGRSLNVPARSAATRSGERSESGGPERSNPGPHRRIRMGEGNPTHLSKSSVVGRRSSVVATRHELSPVAERGVGEVRLVGADHRRAGDLVDRAPQRGRGGLGAGQDDFVGLGEA